MKHAGVKRKKDALSDVLLLRCARGDLNPAPNPEETGEPID